MSIRHRIHHRVRHHLKRHNSGWLWPLIGILAVILFIWWISGNQPAATPSDTGTTTAPKTAPAQKGTTVKVSTATDVASVAAGISNGSIFSSWLKSTGVASELKSNGTYTLFLPTDAAIAQLPAGTFKNLSVAGQKRFVENHIVSGRVIDVNAQVSASIWTLSGDPLNFTRRDGQPTLIGSSVIVAEYKASNGVVYVISGVLIPPQKIQ